MLNFIILYFCKNKTFSDKHVSDEVMSSSCVKLHGVYCLIFDYHGDELCRKVGRKLSVLARLTKMLHYRSLTDKYNGRKCPVLSEGLICSQHSKYWVES